MAGWLLPLVQKPKLYGWAIEKQLNSHFEVLSHVFLAPVVPQALSFQIGEQAIRSWEPKARLQSQMSSSELNTFFRNETLETRRKKIKERTHTITQKLV